MPIKLRGKNMNLLRDIPISVRIIFVGIISLGGILLAGILGGSWIWISLTVSAVLFIILSIDIKNELNYVRAIGYMMSMGDFGRHVDEDRKTKDEIGQLCNNFSIIMENMNRYTSYIAEIERVLGLMAQGELKIELREAFDREFEPVKRALLGISSQLSMTISVISKGSVQVHNSAQQVSDNAMNLASTTAVQARVIDDLLGTVKSVSDSVTDSAQHAKGAADFSRKAQDEVANCVQLMQRMLQVMENMKRSSDEVLKVIKVIDNIAFQTNILSLNANIEAEIAGKAGKGFAIVATQVRKLAHQSAEAANQTAELISANTRAVEESGLVATATFEALEQVAGQTKATMELITKIADGAEKQAVSVSECATALSGFSDSVQSVAGTALVSSEAGEKLIYEAVLLNEEVLKFKV